MVGNLLWDDILVLTIKKFIQEMYFNQKKIIKVFATED